MLPCFHKQVRGFLIDASSAQKAELADDGNKMASSPLTQQSLSPLEVERICRAFIRLLLAQEIPANGNSDQNYKDIPA